MQQALNMRRFQPDDDLVAIARAAPGRAVSKAAAGLDVTIYTIPPSLCSQRVRMALLEKGVRYTEHTINTARGENLEPDYIAMNPRALVPTMKFGDRVMFDSALMMLFINNYFEGPELAPSDPQRFAQMNDWIQRSDDFPIRGFHYRAHLASGLPDYVRVGMHDNVVRARELYPQHRDTYDLKLQDWQDLEDWMANPGDLEEGVRIAMHMADDAETALSTHRFLVGNSISLADITVFILFIRLQCAAGLELWSETLRPNLYRYMEDMKCRDSYDGAVLDPYRHSALVQVTGDCWLPRTSHASQSFKDR